MKQSKDDKERERVMKEEYGAYMGSAMYRLHVASETIMAIIEENGTSIYIQRDRKYTITIKRKGE